MPSMSSKEIVGNKSLFLLSNKSTFKASNNNMSSSTPTTPTTPTTSAKHKYITTI